MITQKTKVKKKFNDGGIQMTIDALNSIDDYVLRIIAQTVKNAVGNDIKRLTGEADQMAQVLPLDNIQPSKTAEEEKSCQRCGSVPSFIMDAAYAMRGHCEDYAKILMRRWTNK
jgi:hypothetical protein|tara:strand:- start:178 stop:519 length:342 start_codon:yes stop_codon:yes gene_type:complete